jgi:hypothetical protein
MTELKIVPLEIKLKDRTFYIVEAKVKTTVEDLIKDMYGLASYTDSIRFKLYDEKAWVNFRFDEIRLITELSVDETESKE